MTSKQSEVGELLFTLEVSNILAEGVQWHIARQQIWWTDIQAAVLYCYTPSSEQLQRFEMPHRVGCFGFIESSDRLIIAFDIGIALYDIESESIEWLAQPESCIEGNRFNDGRIDAQGRFWAGTMVEQASNLGQSGSLYRLADDQKCTVMITGLTISNGLCWSPDGRYLYHADSPEHQIYRYHFDISSGEISNKKLFAQTPTHCFPDGSIVDAQGYLWNAQWGGSRVVRYSPAGEIDLIVELPVSQVSCIAIGGPNLDWLIVTSAQHQLTADELTREPQAGNVFVYQLYGISGMAENQYILT